MKMKKGISLLSLAVAIIVMSILAGIVVISLQNSLNYTNISMFALELQNIQTAVEEYYYRNGEYPSGATIALSTSNIAAGSISQFNKETVVNNNISLKLVNLSLIGISKTEFGNNDDANDVYALSETSGNVYYLSGVGYEGIYYYALTDELYDVVDISSATNYDTITSKDIKKYDVVFTPSTMSYTNSPITVQVKLPEEAIINSVTATQEKSVSEVTTQGAYKVVNINETSTDKTGNYTVQVDYTYDNVQKQVTYDVTTFDNTAPQITTNVTTENGIKTVSISATDDLSGVKVIKYEESQVQDATYFENYGKTVIASQINMDENSSYTIYAVDEAGNYITVLGE